MLLIATVVISLSLITFGVCLLAAERGYAFDLRQRPNVPRPGGVRRGDRVASSVRAGLKARALAPSLTRSP